MANGQLNLPGLRSELEEGEPIFVLRARDPLAPFMAALWAAMRLGDTGSALSIFADMNSDPGYQYSRKDAVIDIDKVNSASEAARDMNSWRKERGLEVFGLHTVSR